MKAWYTFVLNLADSWILSRWVLILLSDKWLKCLRDQNISAKNMTKIYQQKKTNIWQTFFLDNFQNYIPELLIVGWVDNNTVCQRQLIAGTFCHSIWCWIIHQILALQWEILKCIKQVYKQKYSKNTHITQLCKCVILSVRAELIVGQTGQMPGASRLNIKTLLHWFLMFLGCSPCVKIVKLFAYCVSTEQGSPNFFVRGPHKLLLNSPRAT